jgi:hypothetical protein
VPHHRVDAVGQREVNDSVDSSERDRRLCAVAGERHEPFAFTARQNHRENAAHESPPVKNSADISIKRQIAVDELNMGTVEQETAVERTKTLAAKKFHNIP